MRSVKLLHGQLNDLVPLDVYDNALVSEECVLVRNSLIALLMELVELPLFERSQVGQLDHLDALKWITAEDRGLP